MIVDEILKQDSFAIKSNQKFYSIDDVKGQVAYLSEIIKSNIISDALVAIAITDDVMNFFLTLALHQCDCKIMFINILNGSGYCKKIIDTYRPNYIIYSEKYLLENKNINKPSISFFVGLDKFYIYELHKNRFVLSNKKGMIFFTSGTTDVPKAVFRSETNIISDAMNNIVTFSITKNDRVLMMVPFGHVYGLGSGVFPFALKGAMIYFLSIFLSGRKIQHLIEENGITVVIGTPTIYQELLCTNVNLGKCRLLLSAGSKLNNTLFNQFYDKFRKEINNMYGSSETGAITTLYNHSLFDGDSSNCGKPMDNVEVYCDGTLTCAGVVSIKSDSLAEGTIENNKLMPIRNANGWYETNDMGYFDFDGCLHISCRKSEVINIGGEKISPRALEIFFEKKYGEVVAVTEIDARGIEYPVVYVETECVDIETIKAELQEKLSKRFMPKKIYSVDCFPRNRNGKIERGNLLRMVKETYIL